MKALRRLTIAVPALLLLASLIGVFLTRGSMTNLPFLPGKGRMQSRANNDLVDQRPWQTIEALAPLAVSAEEKRLAREAQRLADHEVDKAFAQALRQASLDTHTLTGQALALQQKVTEWQPVIKDDQAKVDSLNTAYKGVNPPGTDDLDIAKAQLQLDTDQLNDANEDLARLSGDKRGQIQQELTAREAAMKKFDEQADVAGPSAVQSARRYGTLAGRVSAWFDQRSRMDSIAQAQAQAGADAASLTAQHAGIEAKLNSANAANSQDTEGKSRVARLAQMHSLAQIHSIVDDRVQTQQQLSVVYGRWLAQVQRQHGIVLHLILQSIAFIAFLLLCGALLSAGIRKLLDRLHLDRRNLITLRTIAALAVQTITILLVLLVIFGAPSQLATILGIATAGLTVVFQGFILAFFGWFILMGKHGIRVGDWVEINGVGGEVVEIGLFRTSLLETGNWTDRGHPTGRRVIFMNSFAISGQYFNFSTSGQWLWDEIRLTLPSNPHTYRVIDAIQKALEQEGAKDAQQAKAEWQRATRDQGLSQFTAEPSIDLRPAASGVEVVARYVTRASDRFATRNRLYQAVLELMYNEEEAPAVTAGER
ncbi:mechanosensitive ion channel family protein [Edaphobacter aggregans]|uniref:mechanosensitive ion channel family protein n=1 Tax=Edaphobacter aggregans TaxID=570835 RepID=UPI00054E9DD6|nr:mechanosensitive ion channel family protein [Edaphobacter aggregans]